MNRKERRATFKRNQPQDMQDGASVVQLLEIAKRCQHDNKLEEAEATYKRVLLLEPNYAEASNNLGCVLAARGKLAEASACFARALELTPQLFDHFYVVCGTLTGVLPVLNEALRATVDAWPNRLPADVLFGRGGLNAIATDPLLLCMLQATPVREIALERLLTSVRKSLLNNATQDVSEDELILGLCCALANQCFINEYIFDVTAEEETQLDHLKSAVVAALDSNDAVRPMALAALAMYRPIHNLSHAQALLDRKWPAAVDAVITKQIRDVLAERDLRAGIPRLTQIEDEVSQLVRQQYEENPYPRWVGVSTGIEMVPLNQHLRELFPGGVFTPLYKTDDLEMLVAGCGTGRHATWIVQRFKNTRILAVDLSLSSICYAKRKTPAALSDRIEYAQADILKLPSLKRTFDVIDASGVLHHMADPFDGWRTLLNILRPGGLMHVCLYSELGRQDVVAVRHWIAERGLKPSPADIRSCRQELLESPLRGIVRFNDFFSMSECRDLLFHVQESRTTIPEIKRFVGENALKFIGFVFDRNGQKHYRALFDQNQWSLTDLDRWNDLESKLPNTFTGMYQFWIQKP